MSFPGANTAQTWKVVGGADSGGILVRHGQDLASSKKSSRLATGAVVEEVERNGERLRYRVITGDGPATGWVSIRLGAKELLTVQSSSDGPTNHQIKSSMKETTLPPVQVQDEPEDACGAVGVIGEALWQSPLKKLPSPPWAPRQDFVALCAGKGKSGWRKLWILGGSAGSHFSDDVWTSSDGGATWELMHCGSRWSPRGRFGATVGSTIPEPGSQRQVSQVQGIVYVVGGYNNTGRKADVWASDNMCRTWHKMNADAPFGARADVACAVVPGSPLSLVVGGGISSDVHRDLWLSQDAGETFVLVEAPSLPRGATFRLWSPDILCTAYSGFGRIYFWRLRVKDTASASKPSAELEPLHDEAESEFVELGVEKVPEPPRVALDLQSQVALVWDSKDLCLAAHPLPLPGEEGTDGEPEDPMPEPTILRDVAAGTKHAYILSDMDSVFQSLRNGFLWVLSDDGKGIWASDRARFRAQDFYLRLLGLRLHDKYGMPLELWLGRVRPMLLPRPRQVSSRSGQGIQTHVTNLVGLIASGT